MLGLDDSNVLAGYLLCIGAVLLCVIYGLITWNRGAEDTDADDVRWAAEEKEVEEEFS
ncbi:MAG: hypothetical protein GXY44_03320 [Phycisphaerales bacterium]|nr:hypothetical protein [Phycisphaerales bacterium]